MKGSLFNKLNTKQGFLNHFQRNENKMANKNTLRKSNH